MVVCFGVSTLYLLSSVSMSSVFKVFDPLVLGLRSFGRGQDLPGRGMGHVATAHGQLRRVIRQVKARTPWVATWDAGIERKLDDEVRRLLHVCAGASRKIYRQPTYLGPFWPYWP